MRRALLACRVRADARPGRRQPLPVSTTCALRCTARGHHRGRCARRRPSAPPRSSPRRYRDAMMRTPRRLLSRATGSPRTRATARRASGGAGAPGTHARSTGAVFSPVRCCALGGGPRSCWRRMLARVECAWHRASSTCGCTPSTRCVDSVVRVPELMAAVAAAGMPAVALTDQNNLFAMVKFYRAALSAGRQAHRRRRPAGCARRASARQPTR